MQHYSTSQDLEHFVKYTFANQGKFIIDPYGKILSHNAKKLSFDFDATQNVITYISTYCEALSAHLIDNLIPLNDSFEGEFSLKSLKEDTQWYRLLISPLPVLDQTVFLLQIFDITKEKDTHLQLKKQRKNIEKEMLLRTREIIMTDEVMANQGGFLTNFLRGLRHDLVSPITQLGEIITYYQKTVDPVKKEKAAGLISDCLLKLNNTAGGFSDFVDLHFIEQEGLESLSFDATFQSIQSLLKSEIEHSKAQFNIDFSQAPHINFNKNKLESIFYNLLSNAIKFRSEDRDLIVNISTGNRQQSIVLEIEDNGIGIDLDKYRDHLFVPFKRLNMNRPGAGIGLSLVKKIITKQGGTIDFESQLGVGSKVILAFLNETPQA